MGISTKVFGKMEKKKEKVYFIKKMIKSYMKVNGQTIRKTVKEQK